MDVCHLVNALSLGGSKTLLLNIIRETGDEISHTVCYLERDSTLADEFRDAGARVVHFDAAVKFDPRALWRMGRFFRSEEFDVLHAHLLQSQVLARLVRFVGDVDVVVSTHHNVPDDYHPLTHFLEGVTRPLDDITVAVSDGVRNALVDDPYLPARNWQTIYNGIDVESFRDAVGSAERTADSDGPIFLNVGRYVPAKAQIDLIEAMTSVLDEYPDAQLYIVGSGTLEGELTDAVTAHGLDGTVHVTGAVPEIHEYYGLADVFVSSSEWEGLPLVLVEAMAAGLPVVATDIPGVGEIVIDGETGRLVPPGEPAALAEAMVALASSDGFGQRGYERVRDEFDVTETARQYERLYRNDIRDSARLS